ncbi:hypothetical protein D3C86_1061870 [compost metagenome]
MGAYSGASTNIITTQNAAYQNGYSLNVHSAGTASAAVPGSTADYFCYQMSTKTVAELYTQGGWGCAWKAMSWVNNSCTTNITWDGTQFWMPTSASVSGNWIGQSPDGKSWNFSQVVGAQPASVTPGYGISLNGVFGFGETSGSTTIVRYVSGSSFTSVVVSGANHGIRTGAASDTRVAFAGGTGRVWTATDMSGPWTEYVPQTSNPWTGATVIPGSTTWVFVGGGGWTARSTNDLATTPTAVQVGTTSYNGVAASPTTVIAVGGSGSTSLMRRSIDQGESYTAVTVPAGSGNLGAIAYGNGVWVCASFSAAIILTSVDDGETWTSSPSPFPVLSAYSNAILNGSYDGLKFMNGRFWLCTTQGAGNSQNMYLLASSVDGISWELHISAPPGAASGNATTSCQGIFAADNVAGTPTNANTSVGFGLNAFPPIVQTRYPTWVVNNAVVGSGAPTQLLNVNQWHEYQIFGRPATTANEWDVTFIMDGVAYGPFTTNTFAAKSTMPMWFMVGRGNFFTATSDIVFYDFPIAQDPGVLGPDLRVYYDQPAVDVLTEWSPSIEGAFNAEMVATTSITGATTFVYESGAPTTDQYTMKPTNVPLGQTILSTKNEAYFSRSLNEAANVSVGVSVDGATVDAPPQAASAPVNSWTYVSQVVDNNPQTGSPWTRQKLNEAQLRIARTS